MRTRIAILTVLLIPALSFRGYAQSKAATHPDARIAQLQREVAELKREVASQDTQITDLWQEVWDLHSKIDAHKTVQLNLASPGKYQRIDTDTGSFLIIVEDAVPYLDGYKVRLQIGNPSTAKYSGFKAKVKWAKKYNFPKFTAAFYREWRKSIQEKEVSFTDTLEPGTWNKVELILSPAGADQLGYFEVSLETETVALVTRP